MSLTISDPPRFGLQDGKNEWIWEDTNEHEMCEWTKEIPLAQVVDTFSLWMKAHLKTVAADGYMNIKAAGCKSFHNHFNFFHLLCS
jgi:hypothetical protein